MSSGKQLSFSYGEVSPSLRYRSDAISYREGLYELRNGYVKKAGGVSNRQGFKFLGVNATQLNIPVEGQDAGYTLHSVGRQYADDSPTVLGVVKFAVNGVNSYSVVAGAAIPRLATSKNTFGNNPKNCQITLIESAVMLTYGGQRPNSAEDGMLAMEWGLGTLLNNGFRAPLQSTLGATGTLLGAGQPPQLPVSYIIMQERVNGEEVLWQRYEDIVVTSGSPHQYRSTKISLNVDNNKYIRRYNVYRAAGSLDSAFGYVGSIPLKDDVVTAVVFYDFVLTPDLLNGPPINTRLWGSQATSPIDWFAVQYLTAVRRACTYQQRMFAMYDEVQDDAFSHGQIGVSKLGAFRMLTAPDAYNAIGAFDFKVPITEEDTFVAIVPMLRLVVFSERAAYIIRGGEQGAITPTEINPLEISSEGCSRHIEPKKSGNNLYYVNFQHTKLIRISFGLDGSATVEDISIFSDHFFRDDISEIEVVRGEQDIVYMVTRTGKLVSVTAQPNSAGFASHDTDGIVESIAVVESPPEFWNRGTFTAPLMDFAKQDSDALVASVIRDGVRNLELLMPRVDRFDEGFAFADSYTNFGARLSLSSLGTYVGFLSDDITLDERVLLNIQGGTTYKAGETLELFCTSLQVELGAATHIDFYYDDEDGVKRSLRFTKNGTATWDGGLFEYKIPGHFEEDVPAQLQDVTAINPSNKFALQTRYCVPQQVITGLTHLANKEVAVFADGQVLSAPLSPDPDLVTLTVDGAGELDLGGFYGYGVIGLPYEFSMQTLPLESSDNRTLSDAQKLINAVGVALDETRGGLFGQSGANENLSDFEPLRVREEESFDVPDSNYSGYVEPPISGSWDEDGRAVIKQVKPLPITVLSVYPKGVSGD